jgi:Ion channel
MHVFAGILGLLLFIAIISEAFSTFVQARRSPSALPLTRYFYRATWLPYSALARYIRDGGRRENCLSVYGPLSILALLTSLSGGLLVGFALMQWAVGLKLNGTSASLPDALFFSGTSLFTIGSGQPQNALAKFLMVLESGMGIGFLGLLVAYLPTLYQSYSSRELRIALMDAHAGSPPTAAALLRSVHSARKLEARLQECESWAAELLEHQLSYPMLSYFRSQHRNQSWIASLTAVLDTSAVTMLCAEGDLFYQARATFGVSRHAVVDLARIFCNKPHPDRPGRLPANEFSRLCDALAGDRSPIDPGRLHGPDLQRLRDLYEPYAQALSLHFLAALPDWVTNDRDAENWRRADWNGPGERFAISDPFEDVS